MLRLCFIIINILKTILQLTLCLIHQATRLQHSNVQLRFITIFDLELLKLGVRIRSRNNFRKISSYEGLEDFLRNKCYDLFDGSIKLQSLTQCLSCFILFYSEYPKKQGSYYIDYIIMK